MNQPVYIQIHDEIKKRIEEGEWKVGDKLPSERELSQLFKVSRMTLRQAIQALSDEGIIERKLGSGTYVSRERVQEKMTGTTSFTEIMENIGKVPSSKTVSYYYTSATRSEIEKLRLQPGERVLRMERIRYADDLPICFEVTTIPERIAKVFSKEEVTNHFYQTLRKHGYSIGSAEQTISASVSNDKISEYLSIDKKSAILRLRQVTYLEDMNVFEYVRSQYVGNRFEFYLEK
ncbi:MAG: GntR family transcriptional regulator [Streptococcaceae bacterium]|jgi:GntR family transcriptional regulator|nr:GntR family transcriptional regulator [Streptococcaceae bacterium]